jgi:hypothetical protein
VVVASSSQPKSQFLLKSLVIGMGLLIVAGFVVVVVELGRRMSTLSGGRPPAAAAFSERVALPPGARVVSLSATADRVVAQVEVPGGPTMAYIVDPRSGALLGTVEFAPGIGR